MCPAYPIGVKKGERSEKLYFEAVWKELLRAGQTLNYHNKQICSICNGAVFLSDVISVLFQETLVFYVPQLVQAVRYDTVSLKC